MAATTQHTTELAMNLRLSKQASEGLAKRAAATGKNVADVASDLIEHAISAEAAADIPYEQWATEFRAWTSDHKPVGRFVDDSRESIYAGRGE